MVFALDRAVFGPCVFISFMDVHHSDIPCLKVEYPIDHWSFYTAFACFRLADAWWNWWRTVGQVLLHSSHWHRGIFSVHLNDIVISSTLVSGFWPVLTHRSHGNKEWMESRQVVTSWHGEQQSYEHVESGTFSQVSLLNFWINLKVVHMWLVSSCHIHILVLSTCVALPCFGRFWTSWEKLAPSNGATRWGVQLALYCCLSPCL